VADGRLACIGLALALVEAGCNCGDPGCEGDDCISYDPTTETSFGDDDDDDDGVLETAGPESSSGREASSGGSSGGPDDQCQGTDTCDGLFCVAPYADNHRGAFACVEACVGPMDESVWCFDDAACCDSAAHCTIRGYCEVEGADSGTGDGTTSTTGTTTDATDSGGTSSATSTG
jgi:hypothetical protein